MDEVLIDYELNLERLIEIIAKWKKDKAPGADGIQWKLAAMIPKLGLELLVHIYEVSWEWKVVPTTWKELEVVMLNKKEGECPALDDKRPIALAKLFLKIMDNQLLAK